MLIIVILILSLISWLFLAHHTLSVQTTVNHFIVGSVHWVCRPDLHILPSNLSSSPHCMVFLGPHSESLTLANILSYNQQFHPHMQPQTATSTALNNSRDPDLTHRVSFLLIFYYINPQLVFKQQNNRHEALCCVQDNQTRSEPF